MIDFLIAALTGIWLAGGIPWPGSEDWILRHGADPRRAALILIGLIAWMGHSQWIGARWPKACAWAQKTFTWKALGMIQTRLLEARFRWRLLAFAAAFAVGLGVLQAGALRVPLYDVGIFHQILWSLAHGLGFHSTISGAGNFLLDHLSPSLALLVPAFALTGESPLFLPVVHALLVFTGVAAWMLLAERLPNRTPEFRNQLAAGILVFALGFDSLWGNLRWGFHENAIAFASLSWALALWLGQGITRARATITVLLLAVTAASKEILLLNVALLVVALAFTTRPRLRLPARAGAVVFAATLFAVFAWFQGLPHPADKNYFVRYYGYLGTTLPEFLKTLVLSPQRVFETIGTAELARYFKTVFLPFLGLPLLLPWIPDGRRRFFLIVGILPSLVSAAIATYPPLRGSGFHYVLELWPVLVAMTLFALKSPRWVWCLAFFSLLQMDQDPVAQFKEYGVQAHHATALRGQLGQIPPEDSVAATELAGTWVAGRRFVTRWPDLALIPEHCPDWIVVPAPAPTQPCPETGKIPKWVEFR